VEEKENVQEKVCELRCSNWESYICSMSFYYCHTFVAASFCVYPQWVEWHVVAVLWLPVE
jgi:hypothetical protein